MSQISTEIGKQIRTFRKKRKMTLEALAAVICKSKSTVSKYENGEIPVDIETLYEIASALQIHVEQLLYCPPRHANLPDSKNSPAFFAGCSQFYAYVYDGRNKQLIRCVFDVLSETDTSSYKIINFIDITPRFLPVFAEKFSFEYLRKSHKIPLFSNKLVTPGYTRIRSSL